MKLPLRWVAVSVFVIASALNYLDRQLLSALAPALRQEFQLSSEDFGWLLSAFSIPYALAAPLAGLFIDRAGLTRGAVTIVGLWSTVGILTGLVGGFHSLVACRAALGLVEAGSIPATGKASALYLFPEERPLGSALSQIGLSTGMVAAPLLAGWVAEMWGWRWAFVVAGALGFVWIPLWLATSARVPHTAVKRDRDVPALSGVLRDPRFWALIAANMLCMTVYSLWTNWTTEFLVRTRGMSQADVNRQLAWIPPLVGTLGGLFGGALSLRLARGGLAVHSARMRVTLLGAVCLLGTAAVPYLPSAGAAAFGIGASLFCVVTMSVNIYAMPLEIFGAERAAFSVSALSFAYGAMQTVFSPAAGRVIDSYGFEPVCLAAAVFPLMAVGVLKIAIRES